MSPRYVYILVDHRGRERPVARGKSNLADPANEVLLSAVSVWELSVKHALGKLPLPSPLDRFVMDERERHGIAALALNERAVLHLHKLPSLHRDPFDRMLICQAIEHNCVLLTPDPLISQYPVRTRW